MSFEPVLTGDGVFRRVRGLIKLRFFVYLALTPQAICLRLLCRLKQSNQFAYSCEVVVVVLGLKEQHVD